MGLGRRLNVLLDMGDFVFRLLLFWGGKGGRRGGEGPYGNCQSAIAAGGAISAIYYAIAAFLSLSFCKIFVVFHTEALRLPLGGLDCWQGAGQGRTGHRAGHGRAWQGKEAFLLFLLLLPCFCFYGDFFPEGGGEIFFLFG